MQERILGRTRIEVTELCFGALPMGPMQKNMPVKECADVVAHALKSGINFVDTAQGYKTYPPIKMAM
ncbi:MAG: aldo/keto reductase, partial [Sporomusa sp.]|nr:aldo/keto reductase [Sporomusa sp.]